MYTRQIIFVSPTGVTDRRTPQPQYTVCLASKMLACSCEINKMQTTNFMLQNLASTPDSCSAGNVMSCIYKIGIFVTVFTTVKRKANWIGHILVETAF